MKLYSLLFVALLMGVPVFAAPTQLTQTEFTATTTSTLALAGNSQRNYLLVQNRGTASVYLKFGSAHVAAEKYVEIPTKGNYEFNIMVPRGPIYLLSSTATQDCTIIEGLSQ